MLEQKSWLIVLAPRRHLSCRGVTRRALEVSCGPVCQSTGKVLCSLLPMSLFQAPTLGPNNPSTTPIARYRLRGVLAVMSLGLVTTACVS